MYMISNSKAWYTDPDLNALNLTASATQNNQNDGIHQTPSQNLQSQHATTNNTTTTARTGSGKLSNENDSECSSVTSDSIPGG